MRLTSNSPKVGTRHTIWRILLWGGVWLLPALTISFQYRTLLLWLLLIFYFVILSIGAPLVCGLHWKWRYVTKHTLRHTFPSSFTRDRHTPFQQALQKCRKWMWSVGSVDIEIVSHSNLWFLSNLFLCHSNVISLSMSGVLLLLPSRGLVVSAVSGSYAAADWFQAYLNPLEVSHKI